MTLKFDDTIQERFVSLARQVGTDMALNDPCFVLVQPSLKVLPTKESTNSRLKRREENSLYWTLNISEAHWSIIKLQTKTYVVGTQKNRLNETVLLSTQNICLK